MSEPNAPVTTAAPTLPSFTSQPIEVSEPAPVSTEPAPVVTPVIAAPDALVSALAKANSESRLSKKQADALQVQITDLTKQLDDAKALGLKTTEAERQLAEIYDRPRILLQKKGFKEILDDLAADDIPVDPRLATIEEKLAARDKADLEAAEAKKKADLDALERTFEDGNAAARAAIAALVKEDGAALGEGGVERWALVSMDAGAIERARLEVIKYRDANKLDLTLDQQKDLLRQAFDMMEADARTDLEVKSAKLKRQDSVLDREVSFSRPQHPTEDKQTPQATVANLRNSPLPAPAARPANGFTNGLR